MDSRALDIETPEARAGNGARAWRPRRSPRRTPPSGRRRVGLALFAAFSLLGFSLGFMLLARPEGSTRPALSLARAIDAGDALSRNDVAEVEVGGGSALRVIAPGEASSLLGRVALVAMDEGTLLDPAFFAEKSALRPGEALVGVTVDPGEGPRRALRPGDPLLLVAVTPPELAAPDAPTGGHAAWWGEVFDATAIESVEGVAGATAVSVKVAEAFAPAVADAAAAGRLRLVLVAAIGPLDAAPAFVDPGALAQAPGADGPGGASEAAP